MNIDFVSLKLEMKENEAKLRAYTLQNRKYPVQVIDKWLDSKPGTLRITTDLTTGRLCVDVSLYFFKF